MFNSVESRLSLPIYLDIAICTMMRGKPRNKKKKEETKATVHQELSRGKKIGRSVGREVLIHLFFVTEVFTNVSLKMVGMDNGQD